MCDDLSTLPKKIHKNRLAVNIVSCNAINGEKLNKSNQNHTFKRNRKSIA